MKSASILFLAALLAAPAALAQNVVVGHQGRLVKGDDTPETGAHTVTIGIYSTETSETASWSESYSVTLFQGIYGVLLGDTRGGKKALPAADVAGERWLEVTVDGTPLKPRLRLGAVPQAATALLAEKATLALDAEKLGGVAASEYAKKTDVSTDAQKLGGKLPGDYLLDTETAADSEKLGGVAAADYLLKTGTAADSAKLGGVAAAEYQLKSAAAADAQKLGGELPSFYAAANHDHDARYIQKGAGGAVSGDFAVTGKVTAGSLEVTNALDAKGGASVTGNLAVSGTINGRVIGYPENSKIAMGMVPRALLSSSSYPVGYIEFPFSFTQPPAFVATIDETLDDSGISWTRLQRRGRNRVAIRSHDYNVDAIHWIAVEPGNHTIDGKKVMAGITPNATTGSTIQFPGTFPSEPVVLVYIDESGDNSGGTYVRVINNASTTSFQYYLDGNSDAVHWIAFEPGTYKYGRYTFTAGQFQPNNTCAEICTLNLGTPYADLPNVVASVFDTNNGGASWLRLQRLAEDQIRFRLNTYTERINYVTFSEAR